MGGIDYHFDPTLVLTGLNIPIAQVANHDHDNAENYPPSDMGQIGDHDVSPHLFLKWFLN